MKRWESDGYRNPSDEAWALIDREYEVFKRTIATDIKVFSHLSGRRGEVKPVEIAYWRSQEQIDEVYPMPMKYLRANANARIAAIVLETLGIDCTFISTDPIVDQIKSQGMVPLGGSTQEEAPRRKAVPKKRANSEPEQGE